MESLEVVIYAGSSVEADLHAKATLVTLALAGALVCAFYIFGSSGSDIPRVRQLAGYFTGFGLQTYSFKREQTRTNAF